MDNFRGFSNTSVRLQKVNFLVGENSTGKSSFLGLVNIFSCDQFWEEGVLETDDVKLGHFEDIVSVFSKNKSCFIVGFYQVVRVKFNKNKKPEKRVIAHVFKYIEYEGAPYLADYLMFDGVHEVRVLKPVGGNDEPVRYTFNKVSGINTEEDFVERILKKWRTGRIRGELWELPNDGMMLFDKYKNSIITMYLDIHRELKEKGIFDKNGAHGRGFFPFPLRGIFYSGMAWMAPIRTKPKRTYDEYTYKFSPEGEHTPYHIKQVLKHPKDKKRFEIFIGRLGKDSGLFDDLFVRNYDSKSITSPFELDVKLNKKTLSVNNVGYGIAQVLPIIVEMFIRPKDSCLALQQPEVHLHPKAQAALGSAIFNLADSEEKHFLIETHSDYVIDRFRISFRKSRKKKKPSSQIIFFERDNRGNHVYQLEIGAMGEMPSDQPKGYRDFFIKEELELLGLK